MGKRVIGVKQSRRVLREGIAKEAFIADDAEPRIRLPLLELCEEMGVPVTPVATMKELGALSGIEVGAAVAVEYGACDE